MECLEDGKNVFRLRMKLCSSLFPVNDRIRDFFLEYDRHTLRTSPPWGSELLEVPLSLSPSPSPNLFNEFIHGRADIKDKGTFCLRLLIQDLNSTMPD